MADITQQNTGIPGQVSFSSTGNPATSFQMPAPAANNVAMFGQVAAQNPFAGSFNGGSSAAGGNPFTGAFQGGAQSGITPQWSAPAAPPPVQTYQAPPYVPPAPVDTQQASAPAPVQNAAAFPSAMTAPFANEPWAQPGTPFYSYAMASPNLSQFDNPYNVNTQGMVASPEGGQWKGGPIEKVFGANPPTPDDGQINAQIGEFVIRKDAVSKYGKAVLAAINSGKIDPAKLRRLVPKK